MLRRIILFACVFFAFGCQSKAPPAPARTANLEPQYEAVVASALVFDPPVAQDEPRLELSRASREPRVSVGYEELTTETFYIRFDDRQISNSFHGRGFGGGGSYDQYERRAVTERTGVRYR